jgi:DNA modification methylase
MTEKKIKISETKGRPMLNWVGKKPLDFIKSFPAQLVEVFDPTGESKQLENPTFDDLKDNWQNLIFHGDNKEVLGYLLANGFRGKVGLIYIDPPFDSGANYIRKPELRGIKKQISGEDYSLGEQVQYFDIWANDNYLQYMYERLQLLKELLSDEGAILIHLDYRRVHQIRIIMDEIFGEPNFRNEIVWSYRTGGASKKEALPRKHDVILLYSKTDKFEVKSITERQYLEKSFMDSKQDEDGRFYVDTLLRDTFEGVINRVKNNKIITYNLRPVLNLSSDRTDYPTQKPDDLIKLLMEICSKKDSIILDCFIGSGTTIRSAQKTNRKWICADINKGAILTSSKSIQKIINEQSKNGKQKTLNENSEDKYLSFAHYKVNDYDLQLLRTEAIELAVQHIGIQRTKTDNFFEGTLGKNLVKIIDFNHPLTLLDLQLIQDELKKRPDENRNVTIVCLGKELSTDSYIEDYNKKHPVNKIEVIELRTDSKYGKFLIHKPAQAKVSIKRKGDKAQVEIKDFISPSIIERLNDGEKLIKVKIPDFRSMIDVVLIDTEYNGKVFNIKHSDVPEKKKDFVLGKYELDVPKKTTIAVKIIDMLGEEVLITEEI